MGPSTACPWRARPQGLAPALRFARLYLRTVLSRLDRALFVVLGADAASLGIADEARAVLELGYQTSAFALGVDLHRSGIRPTIPAEVDPVERRQALDALRLLAHALGRAARRAAS